MAAVHILCKKSDGDAGTQSHCIVKLPVSPIALPASTAAHEARKTAIFAIIRADSALEPQ